MNQAKLAGGRRIRQKRRGSKTMVKNAAHNNYTNSVQILNTKIEDMKDNDYLKFRDFSTKLVNAVAEGMRRDDFKDRKEFKTFKENRVSYLYKLLFIPKNEVKIVISGDNFKKIIKTFSECGVESLERLMTNLYHCIINRTYDQIDEAKEYNKDSFDESCNILGVEVKEKILFSDVKKAYEEKLMENIDETEKKVEINKAFMNIRNQYENYLKTLENNTV